MSHITTIDIEIRDLDALERACSRCGLELARGQTTFKWWGSRDQRCKHAIRVPASEEAHEIGVVDRNDGRGFALNLDQGVDTHGLLERCGRNCDALKQAYAIEVATAEAVAQGMTVQEERMPDGSVRLCCTAV